MNLLSLNGDLLASNGQLLAPDASGSFAINVKYYFNNSLVVSECADAPFILNKPPNIVVSNTRLSNLQWKDSLGNLI